MKNIITLIVLILVPLISMGQSPINIEKSNIKWTGKKITNASHWGSLSFIEANLVFDGTDLIEGNFVVDMSSITVDDIQGRGKERLEKHLKDDDFFSVYKFDKAFLKFKNKSKLVDGKYDINGELTIKGITNPVVFTLIPGDGNYIANLTFDRIKFDVTYNSGSFIENLGDRLILDEVELEVSLVY